MARRNAVLRAASALTSFSTAQAQTLPGLDTVGAALGAVAWWSVTAGSALAALVFLALLLLSRRDERTVKAESHAVALRAQLDRAELLLDADDQRTVVWDKAVSEPEVFGGLPERVGAPVERSAFLSFGEWMSQESAASVDTAVDKLRRHGQAFQIALRTAGGALVEATGRTSGRRAIVRLRELSGERRSFAELKEQAAYVVNEVAALRSLADLLPIPLWRRNRVGRLTWVNAAYARAVEVENAEAVVASGIELLPIRTREAIREANRQGHVLR